ncbi:hypothetical protein Nizo1840_2142 [Lactiplantibacillus plantarum]|nr:hypothetical protein Nizo1840_2142 [Lactiplantibacillus plantarum]
MGIHSDLCGPLQIGICQADAFNLINAVDEIKSIHLENSD